MRMNLSPALTILFSITLFAVGLASGQESGTQEPPAQTKQIKTDNEQNPKKEDAQAVQNLQFFDSVIISSLGTLHIKQSNEPNFTIEADKKVLPLIITYVKDKVLYIDMKNQNENSQAKIDFYLNVKNLKNITLTSTATVNIDDFTLNELNLSVSNFGESNIRIFAEKFTGSIEGSGKINAVGAAQIQNININGAGEFHGAKFSGKEATVNINGSGMVSTAVETTLNVNISGEGIVQYCQEPKITKEIKGKGKVSPSSEC